MLMSHFFEAISDEVCRNRLVRIPGFGAFGAKAWFSKHDPELTGACYPAFSAAVPFRNAVRFQCPPTGASLDAIDRHRRHSHRSGRPERSGRSPWSTHRAMRKQIAAQARKLGLDV
jgi:hypothetical protein